MHPMFSRMAARPLAPLALALLCAIHLATPLAAAAPPPLELSLRAHVQLPGARILLGDVADLPAGAAPGLALLDLGPAPRVHAIERLNRGQIALLVRRRFGQPLGALAWSGADSVTVQRQSQAVAGAALANYAAQAVLASFGARHPGMEASVPTPPADVDIAPGEYRISARALQAPQLPARVAVWLDLVAGGQVLRSVVVPVAVTWRQPAYLARRRLAAGSVVGPADFEVREENVAGQDARPVAADAAQSAPGWRLRHAMQPGQLLTRALLPAAGTVFPGDRVRVRASSGGVGIESDAVVQAEAGPGQMVAVRGQHSSDTVTGRLTDAGIVVID